MGVVEGGGCVLLLPLKSFFSVPPGASPKTNLENILSLESSLHLRPVDSCPWVRVVNPSRPWSLSPNRVSLFAPRKVGSPSTTDPSVAPVPSSDPPCSTETKVVLLNPFVVPIPTSPPSFPRRPNPRSVLPHRQST